MDETPSGSFDPPRLLSPPRAKVWIRIGKLAGVALVLAAIWFVGMRSLASPDKIRSVARTASQAGFWGLALYCALIAASTVLLLPGLFFSLIGGFLFGPVKGTALFILGEIAGASLAYWIARLFFGPGARRYFLSHPKLAFLSESLAEEGWRFIALTRMIPLFPFKLSNYYFGVSGFRFAGFFWGTALGTLPLTFALVYIGSLIPDLTGVEKGVLPASTVARVITITAAVLSLAGLVLVSKRAAKKYRDRLAALKKTGEENRSGAS